MNCCDDYGNCRQGRDCPVRVERLRKIRDMQEDPIRSACVTRITYVLIALICVVVASLYKSALAS